MGCLLQFIRWLNNFGEFYCILIGLSIKLSVETFLPLSVVYRYFCESSLGMSYPFGSLRRKKSYSNLHFPNLERDCTFSDAHAIVSYRVAASLNNPNCNIFVRNLKG